MRLTISSLGSLIVLVSLASGPPNWTLDKTGKLIVPIARKCTVDEMPVLSLKVRGLPRGAKIVISSMEQEIIGGVAPFGGDPAAEAIEYAIPVPEKLIRDNKATLKLVVHEQDGKIKRAPLRLEIEDAGMTIVPAAPRSQDK